jgi:hypothetical protein
MTRGGPEHWYLPSGKGGGGAIVSAGGRAPASCSGGGTAVPAGKGGAVLVAGKTTRLFSRVPGAD